MLIVEGMKPVNPNVVAQCSAGQRVRRFIPALFSGSQPQSVSSCDGEEVQSVMEIRVVLEPLRVAINPFNKEHSS